MRRKTAEALLGAAVVAVAAWFFIFTWRTTDFGAVEGYRLSARFERVDGLSAGADVRLGGIKVGTVVDQEIDRETFQAVVRFTVDPGIRLPVDTAAEISTEGLLGTTYLSLKPGGMDEYLEDGDQVEFTQGAIDVVDMIGKAIFGSASDDGASEGRGAGENGE